MLTLCRVVGRGAVHYSVEDSGGCEMLGRHESWRTTRGENDVTEY